MKKVRVKLANKLVFDLFAADIISDGNDGDGNPNGVVKLALPMAGHQVFGKRYVQTFAPWFVLSMETITTQR